MSVQAFLRWWGAELVALVPARLRDALARPAVIDPDAPPLRVPAREVGVRLAPSHALRREIELPLAAERRLREAVGFEMDRYTAFPAEAVHYECTVLSRDPGLGTMRVALTAVPRERAERAIARVRQLGAEPAWLELGDTRVRLAPARARRRRLELLALAALAGVLLAAAVALPLVGKSAALARLEEETARLRREAEAADAARGRLEAALAEERALLGRRSRPAAIELLEELSGLLPEPTWLTHFELSGSRVRVRGESANAAELPAALEGSPLLAAAALEGSVTRDPGAARERFTLTATATRKGER